MYLYEMRMCTGKWKMIKQKATNLLFIIIFPTVVAMYRRCILHELRKRNFMQHKFLIKF